jgi:hypothetical protein
MNNNFTDMKHQKVIHRYIRALDEGNLDDVLQVLEKAADDPVLDQMIVEINYAIEQEEGLTPFAQDAELVRALVQKHFDGVRSNESQEPLTVGEVAARMQADRSVPISDQPVHKNLLQLTTPLPEFLNIQAIRKLATTLQVNASEKFWRVFRDTAIMMGIGRGQAQMAAARKQKARKSAIATTKNDKKSK